MGCVEMKNAVAEMFKKKTKNIFLHGVTNILKMKEEISESKYRSVGII